MTIVRNGKTDARRGIGKGDRRLGSAGMFCNIGERFLRNAEDHRFVFSGQPTWGAVDDKGDRQLVAPLILLDIPT